MTQEHRAILENQLRLLSERAQMVGATEDLARITMAMVDVVRELDPTPE